MRADESIPSWLSTYRVRGHEIRGPFFLAPINTGFVAAHKPLARLVEFHRARSGNGIAINYVGNVAVHEEFVNSQSTGVMKSPQDWQDVASAIRRKGSIAGIQLACQLQGTASVRKWVNSRRQDFIESEAAYFSSIPPATFERIVNAFNNATKSSLEAGFDVIQIHAAHGYFLSKALNPLINRRSDRYGDGIALLKEVICAVRSASNRCIVDVRLSLFDGIEDRQLEVDRTITRVAQIAAVSTDIVSLSAGMYDINRTHVYPNKDHGHACYESYAVQLATRFPAVLFNIAGNIWEISKLSDVPSNLTYGIGRPLIADPEFVLKSITGRQESIVECKRCNKCHYFSRGKLHIECGVNSEL